MILYHFPAADGVAGIDLVKGDLFFSTAVLREGASALELAAGWGIEGAWHIA